MSKITTPYLDWIVNHTNITEYCKDCIYQKSEYVTSGRSIYQSTIDNNTTPLNSNCWIKIL